MPLIDLAGARIHYRLDGPADAPVVVLSNSLGTDFAMWDPQIPALVDKFRVLRYDSRGHGQSAVTPGSYTIDMLARDALALIDALGLQHVRFCGLSMGGMVGQWLGANAANRLEKLVLCNTTARIGTPDAYNTRIENVRRDGMASVVDAVLARWFTPAFHERSPDVIERMRAMMLRVPADGYIASCEAVRDMDQRGNAARITVPTLVIAGTHDIPTPPSDARFLVERVPNARYVELAAAHISNIEAAPQFTKALMDFLSE